MGYSPRGHKESDMTERLHFTSCEEVGGTCVCVHVCVCVDAAAAPGCRYT